MKAADTDAWSFTQAPQDDSEVKCNACGEWSALAEWKESDVPCDVCGDHSAMQCPKCFESEDHVWSDIHPMEVRSLPERDQGVIVAS